MYTVYRYKKYNRDTKNVCVTWNVANISDHHDITGILLKVVLNTITLTRIKCKIVVFMNLQGEKPMETDGSSPTSSISEDSDWSMNSQKIIDLQLLRKIIKTADCGLSRQKVCKTRSCK